MSKKRWFLIILFSLIAIGGVLYALWPKIHGTVLSAEFRQISEEYIEKVQPEKDEDTPENRNTPSEEPKETEEENKADYSELLAAMQTYNMEIYDNGQSALTDENSYQRSVLNLADYGVEDGIIGVITIPKINIEMPIYHGASSANMAAGAAQLSYTSFPIGGENTNCVIAGHRGWGGADYFRHLDELEVGDEITITNFWETMTYRVSEIRVVYPSDVEAILIQPGRDMVTLLTCHPYASGGKYRLLVYCERVET